MQVIEEGKVMGEGEGERTKQLQEIVTNATLHTK